MARRSIRPGNLPAETTSFVGRRRELSEVKQRLSDSRLVTLVGPGGVGKTRLALRAAAHLARAFPNGAWLVELAEVRDPALTANVLASALDLRAQTAAEPIELLCAYLADRRLLLVVDNCEHLVEVAAEVVSRVLRSAPDVRVLATSREPLSVSGEFVVPVPPLRLPDPDGQTSLAKLEQNEAVALFCERAAAAAGAFQLTASNQAAVVELCRRIDGLPLAIELAAVRTRVLSADQIVRRLADRFALLTHGTRAALPRHQTLEATIDWSHELLSEDERALLRRLSVFAGRFTIDDVEGVCAGALETLSSLVEKSLAVKEDAGYRLHETIREYARVKLRESGEEQRVDDVCADYFVARADRFGHDTRFHLPVWLEWADLEMDNVREVLRRCISRGDRMRGLALATAMAWAWITHATSEGVAWLDQLLAEPHPESPGLGWAYFIRGFLSTIQGDAAAARPWLDRAIHAGHTSGDRALQVHALGMASVTCRMSGDADSAGRLLAEARAEVAGLDDVAAMLGVLQSEAIAGYFQADLDAVRDATTAGIELARGAGELYALDVMLGELAGTLLLTGDAEGAKPLYVEGLLVTRRIDDRVTQFYYVDALAALASMSGDARRAAQLLGASRAMQVASGATPLAFMAPISMHAEEAARAALGEARFAAELEAGRRLSRDAALDLAIGASPAAPQAEASDPSVLARREADVARLVADGLTNKEIGARLFISQRTVDTHVRSILNKHGFSSRAQIAAWVAR